MCAGVCGSWGEWGVVLCIIGLFAASLASPHQMPEETPPPFVTTRISLGIAKCTLGSWRGEIAFG